MSSNMKLFRNKTIKYERKVISDKKSDNYDVIGNEHKAIMESFRNSQMSLPSLRKQIDLIDNELETLKSDEGILLLKDELSDKIKELTFERSQYKDTESVNDEEKADSVPKKAKKAKKAKNAKKTKNSKKIMVVENGDEDQIEINLIDEQLNEATTKLSMLDRIFTRNSYAKDLIKKKERILEQITDIEENTNELEYFSKNIDILDEFYTVPNVAETDTTEISVLDFFNRPQVVNTSEIERHNLIERYLQTTNGQRRHKKVNLGRICDKCKFPKVLNTQEGTFTCRICGEVEFVLMDPDKPSYNAGTEQKNNTYRRINHCTEILNQSQGKESTEIDDDLMKDILDELNVRNILDLSTVTKDDIKSVLKSIGMSNKSEHATHIANKLNGIPVRTIPYRLIEIVKAMWKMIEEAWVEIKDPDRKNFMNSSFLFHKIFELLDEQEEAEKWPYLANDKLRKYDVDWEKICAYWSWDFIRSV